MLSESSSHEFKSTVLMLKMMEAKLLESKEGRGGGVELAAKVRGRKGGRQGGREAGRQGGRDGSRFRVEG